MPVDVKITRTMTSVKVKPIDAKQKFTSGFKLLFTDDEGFSAVMYVTSNVFMQMCEAK